MKLYNQGYFEVNNKRLKEIVQALSHYAEDTVKESAHNPLSAITLSKISDLLLNDIREMCGIDNVLGFGWDHGENDMLMIFVYDVMNTDNNIRYIQRADESGVYIEPIGEY